MSQRGFCGLTPMIGLGCGSDLSRTVAVRWFPTWTPALYHAWFPRSENNA